MADSDKLTLQQDDLKVCGGVALVAEGSTVYVGGTDRQVYECKKGVKPIGKPFNADIKAVVAVSNKRLASERACKSTSSRMPIQRVVQTLDLPEDGMPRHRQDAIVAWWLAPWKAL
ncbi:MAG: hypothetical protein U0792_03315 [Gemmataceae bacterium]